MILLMKYIEFNTYGDTTDLSSDEYTINNTNIDNIKSNATFTIITGASSNHFCPLKAFLYNIHETLEGFNYNIIVYDLGLSRGQRNVLKRLKKLNYLSDLKPFNFSKYPSFWNIKEGRGEYAWKPAIIKEVSEDYPGILIWSDSGTKIERFFFEKLKKFDKRFDGFASPTSPGLMEDWTHLGVYDYYNDDHSKYDKLVNCNGAFVMFNTHKVQYLIDQWYDCALIKDCIAPPGSSRINHRQDQSILTYLAARDNRYCNENRKLFGVTTHEDRNCKDVITNYESNNLYSDNV